MPVMMEPSFLPVIDIHTPGKGADPHIPIAVPVGGMEGVIAQAGIIHIIVQVIVK